MCKIKIMIEQYFSLIHSFKDEFALRSEQKISKKKFFFLKKNPHKKTIGHSIIAGKRWKINYVLNVYSPNQRFA